jgi:uncharacterized NAD(P)/FAD-binding protein YdhS
MSDPLQQHIRTALDERARDLDGHTLSRLRQIRAQAMQQQRPIRRWQQPTWTGGLALAALALVAVLGYHQMPGEAPTDLSDSEEAIEIATLDVDLEVIEDLDFYEWLSEQPLDTPSDGGSA